MAQKKIALTNQNNTIILSSHFTRRELGQKSIRIQMRTIICIFSQVRLTNKFQWPACNTYFTLFFYIFSFTFWLCRYILRSICPWNYQVFSSALLSVSKNDYFVDRCSINYPPLLNGRIHGPPHHSKRQFLARSFFFAQCFFFSHPN